MSLQSRSNLAWASGSDLLWGFSQGVSLPCSHLRMHLANSLSNSLTWQILYDLLPGSLWLTSLCGSWPSLVPWPKRGWESTRRLQPQSFYDLISEVTPHDFCCVWFLRSWVICSSPHSRPKKKEVLEGRDCWGHLKYCPPCVVTKGNSICLYSSVSAEAMLSFSANRVPEAIPASPACADLFRGSIRTLGSWDLNPSSLDSAKFTNSTQRNNVVLNPIKSLCDSLH